MISLMRLVHFLTFVLFTALVLPGLASPDANIAPSKIDSSPVSPWLKEGEELIRSRKNSPHSLTASLGYLTGPLVDSGQNRNTFYLGLNQNNQNRDFTSQNFGLELTQIGLIGAHLTKRNSIALGKNYEPYYEFGVGALYKPQEGLGSLITYQRYQARLGCGFEDFLHLQNHLKTGIEIGLSTLGLSIFVNLGYSMPD